MTRGRILLLGAILVGGVAYYSNYKKTINPDSEYTIKHKVVEYWGQSDDRLPMVIVLHGAGADEDDLAPLFEKFNIPLRAVFLRGPVRFSTGYAWWKAPSADAGLKMVDQIANDISAAATTLPAKHPTLGSPMLLGFSAGAEIAYYIAAKYPDAYSAIIAVAGKLHPILRKSPIEHEDPGTFVYGLHGSSDKTISPSAGKSAAQFVRQKTENTTFQLWSGGHTIPETLVKDVLLETIDSFGSTLSRPQ
jgi:phospholipase/carboxylesterase